MKYTVADYNTNNGWGFGGGIGQEVRIETPTGVYGIRVGKACYRHLDPHKYVATVTYENPADDAHRGWKVTPEEFDQATGLNLKAPITIKKIVDKLKADGATQSDSLLKSKAAPSRVSRPVKSKKKVDKAPTAPVEKPTARMDEYPTESMNAEEIVNKLLEFNDDPVNKDATAADIKVGDHLDLDPGQGASRSQYDDAHVIDVKSTPTKIVVTVRFYDGHKETITYSPNDRVVFINSLI